MDLNNIHISISGIDYSVDMSFFEKVSPKVVEYLLSAYYLSIKS